MFLKRSVLLLFAVLMAVSSVFSVCQVNPDYIKVYSGTKDQGQLSSGDTVYIHSNLEDHPLKIELYIQNSDSSCFSAESDFKFKLFSTAVEKDAILSTDFLCPVLSKKL